MAAKKSSPAMQLIVQSLTDNRAASYADIAAAAEKKKLTVHPIMYGRAQALLGIVKQAARGQGKAAKARAKAKAKASASASASTAVGQKRGPGRPRKSAAPAFAGTLEGIVAAVKGSEQSKARYRKALERIQDILSEAIGG